MASAIILDRLVRFADLLAQFGDSAEQELVNPVHRLDLVEALIFEISLGQDVGDGGRGGGVLRLRLDAENVRAAERRDVDAGEQSVDHPVFVARRSGGESGKLVGIGSLRLGRRQLGDPGIDHRRQVLLRVQARPERGLAQAGIEFRIVAKLQLVDHLLGDVARLQDESLVLDAFRVRTDIGDERLDIGQARGLDADLHPCLRNVDGGHRPRRDDRCPAQHYCAQGDQSPVPPQLADRFEEALFLRGWRQSSDRFGG